MGNTNSTKSAEKQFDNFYEIIDYIATYYILTMDFKSLSKLSKKEYCDELVIITSDIIQNYFNDVEVSYLAQRVKNGLEVNEMKKENVVFLTKDQLESLDIQNDAQKSIRKKRVCIGIAKFYIKIAHVFAAIVKTINPIYMYKDENGNTVKKSLLEKDEIPKNTSRTIVKLNICDNRINALNRGLNDQEKGLAEEKEKDKVYLNPKMCESETRTLEDEPGIQELMRLYLDDNYDYSTGEFTGMSEKTKKQFRKDLETFYYAFTGESKMPSTITKFSDIKLRTYESSIGCRSENPFLKRKIPLDKKDKLFVDYANNIKNMINSASDNQSKLLAIINELFVFVDDPYSSKKKIRVNPKLNDAMLQSIIERSRNIIIKLYLKCETDYLNGIKIFEAIVERKILETTQMQIENLKKQANKLIDETKKIAKPEKKPFIISVEEPNPIDEESTQIDEESTQIDEASISNEEQFIPVKDPDFSLKENSEEVKSLLETIPTVSVDSNIPYSTTNENENIIPLKNQ